jgi:hypothetical protein
MCSETSVENDDIVELETYSNRTYSKRVKNDKSSLTRELFISYNKPLTLDFNDRCDTIASKSLKNTFDNDDDENSGKRGAINLISACTDKFNLILMQFVIRLHAKPLHSQIHSQSKQEKLDSRHSQQCNGLPQAKESHKIDVFDWALKQKICSVTSDR